MMRGVAAFVVVLGVSSAQVHAQGTVLTVTVSSADVHKGPSVVTPVIGHVLHGTAMPVVRNLGSWVRVDWSGAPEGFGYLHVSSGRLTSRTGATAVAQPTLRSSSAPAPAPTAVASAVASVEARVMNAQRPRHERVIVRSQNGASISHVVGIGGLFGPTRTFGATTRAWRDDRLGVQVGFSRDAMTSGAGRVTSTALEPAVVYGLFDRVGDYFWIRPYVGSGVSIRHQTFHDAALAGAAASSDTGLGFRVFGGAEASFAGAPRFGLSVDFGYRRLPAPFPGFEPDRFGASVSGHWYVK